MLLLLQALTINKYLQKEEEKNTAYDRTQLTLSENFGLGTAVDRDLKIGVT